MKRVLAGTCVAAALAVAGVSAHDMKKERNEKVYSVKPIAGACS